MSKKIDKDFKLLQKNKKAYFNYEIVEDFECGIALVGTEVKSIREGRFSFGDSYIKIKKNSLILTGFTIQPYKNGSIFNHEPLRERNLLAHKQEVKKMRRKVEEKGMTLIVTQVYIKKNLIKVQVSLAKGKTTYDKKNTIKEKDMKKAMAREIKESFR